VIEAFRDAPGGGVGAPCGLVLGEAGDEGFGVGLSCCVGVVQEFQFGEILDFGGHVRFIVSYGSSERLDGPRGVAVYWVGSGRKFGMLFHEEELR
jgi:hypothetical protein